MTSDTITEPVVPRTTTPSYRFPPITPLAGPAEECTREELLDLAAGAVSQQDQLWALVGSQPHVKAICRLLVERFEPELRTALQQLDVARGVAATALAGLEREKRSHQQTLELMISEMKESVRLAELGGKLSSESRQLRDQSTATEHENVTLRAVCSLVKLNKGE